MTANDAGTRVDAGRTVHKVNETIRVSFSGMQAKNKDWIGIYREGSSNDWDNIVAWAWTNDQVEGSLNFDGLGPDNYEVRAFFNNSFNVEATAFFIIEVDHNPPLF